MTARTTIVLGELKRLAARKDARVQPSGDLHVVEHAGRRIRWAGNGWTDLGGARGDEPLVVMSLERTGT